MNLTRVLQPYVCCLGNPVAGNPTQFVMYRAARAAGVDWRFFTSQVEIDQFEIAFRGVQALGLSGMALFEPFQIKSLSLLDSVTESAMCLGRVKVARLDGNSWLGDNTLGAAIVNCIASQLEPSQAAKSPEKQETEGNQPPCVLVIGDSNIAKAMRLANDRIAERIMAFPSGGGGDIDSKDIVADSDLSHAKSSWNLGSFDEFARKDRKVDCLILQNIPNAALTRQIAGMQWSTAPSCLILGNSSEKQLRLWKDSMKMPDLMQVDSVELMAHQAAADFQFWTGVSPVIDLIRDSLEEYMQW